MTSFEKVKEFITELEKRKFSYYVFGGFAVDSLVGSLQRNHEDLDILILEKDKPRFIDFLKNKFSFHWDKRRLKINGSNLNVDVLFLKEIGDKFELLGNKGYSLISKQFFNNINGKIDNFEFNIIPLEWLIKKIIYFDNEIDRKNLIKFRKNINLELLDEITDKLIRPKTDPKLKEYEKRKKELGIFT